MSATQSEQVERLIAPALAYDERAFERLSQGHHRFVERMRAFDERRAEREFRA